MRWRILQGTMSRALNQRAFRGACYLGGAVATAAGLHTIVAGAKSVPGKPATNAQVESELRFYSAFYVAYGAALIRLAPQADRDTPGVRAAMAVLFLAGLGRAAAWLTAGKPHPGQQALLGLELGIPPAILGWQNRLTKRD